MLQDEEESRLQSGCTTVLLLYMTIHMHTYIQTMY
jgi:hypothetical protein